jgi:hypothetical protein
LLGHELHQGVDQPVDRPVERRAAKAAVPDRRLGHRGVQAVQRGVYADDGVERSRTCSQWGS